MEEEDENEDEDEDYSDDSDDEIKKASDFWAFRQRMFNRFHGEG